MKSRTNSISRIHTCPIAESASGVVSQKSEKWPQNTIYMYAEARKNIISIFIYPKITDR